WQRTFSADRPAAESSSLTAEPKSSGQPREEEAGAAAATQAGDTAALPSSVSQEESFTVRVPSERLDRMLNLAGELRIVQRSGEELSQRLADLNRFLADVLDRCQLLEQVVGQSLEKTEFRNAVQVEITNLRPQLEGCRDQVG